MNNQEDVLFHPRPSNGQTWVLGIAVSTLLLFLLPIVIGRSEIPVVLVVFLLVLGLATTAPMFAVAWYFPAIRYVIGVDSLTLSMGRLMHDRIPFEQITGIEKRERLRISLLASFRFPGLAVFDVDYLDINRVRMLATSASKDILLIHTEMKRYGITPQNEERFLEVMSQRLPDPSMIEISPDTGKL